MSEPHFQELATALSAVREAARLCRAVQEEISPSTLEKKDKSPVTVADFGSQALVCRALKEAFPRDPIIAEEDSAALRSDDSRETRRRVVEQVAKIRPADEEQTLAWIDFGRASEYAPRFWTLDPIDGTKGFLRKEQYAIALALVVNGRVEVAALGCPNLEFAGRAGQLFSAVRGGGCRVGPLWEAGEPVATRVSSATDAARARFCESVESGHSRHDAAADVARRLGVIAPGRRLDSQAKYGVLAAGEAEIYLRLPTSESYREKIWDHAAGALVVTEAGGRVTDVTGRELDFTRGAELETNRGVVATSGPLHERVLAILAELGVR